MLKLIRNFIYNKEVLDIDVDGIELSKIHLNIIKKKSLLRSAYKTFYKDMSYICDNNFVKKGFRNRTWFWHWFF